MHVFISWRTVRMRARGYALDLASVPGLPAPVPCAFYVCRLRIIKTRTERGPDSHRYNTYVRVAFLRWFGLNCLWDSIYKNGGLGNEACLY